MIPYLIMAGIVMVSVLAFYIYKTEPDDGAEYALGVLISALAGIAWPVTAIAFLAIGVSLGVLALLKYLNIIRRW